MIRPPRPTQGLLILVALAVLGYGLLTIPPKVIAGYNAALEQSPIVAYIYLALVSIGGFLLLGLASFGGYRIWRNTRQKTWEREQRGQTPSEMSSSEQSGELDANLAATREYALTAAISPQVRDEIENALAQLEKKRELRQLEIVAFGSISSGKSSLLNALSGRDAFQTDVIGGTTTTRNEIPWPGGDRVTLVDTPGVAEVRGEARAAEAAQQAHNADLVLFVVDGPLREYEHELLDALLAMEKRLIVCLNKSDWYEKEELKELASQLAEQLAPRVELADIVPVRSNEVPRTRICVAADGTETEEVVTEPPDIAPLADRMLKIVERDGRELLLANLLWQSRGVIDEAKERVLATLDQQAEATISKYMWAAGSVTAINPVPLLDLAGGTAVISKMIVDLASIYRQKIDADTIVTILGQLGKNLVALVGTSAASPAVAAGIGSMLKTVPGIGTIAGGLIQGIVQAVVTRWIGRVFMVYFRNEMKPPEGGLAQIARDEWQQLTSPEQLRKLVQLGRRQTD